MTQTIPVKNVARRPLDIEGGRVLAHGEFADVPDGEHLRAQIATGLLAHTDGAADPADAGATTNTGDAV